MFTLPPRTPKDYVLTNVTQNQKSAEAFTPDACPRVTQSNLAKFLTPIYADDEKDVKHVRIESVHPQVLERWANTYRSNWVDRPGENAFYLHEMCKKYTLSDTSTDWKCKHHAQIFPRSYKYELECVEDRRLQKLREKVAREKDSGRQPNSTDEERNKPLKLQKQPCQHEAPFWWPQDCTLDIAPPPEIVPKIEGSAYTHSYKRWQDDPGLFIKENADECKRKMDLAVVGQPFKHEAINFYYKHYPAPSIPYRPEKFSR